MNSTSPLAGISTRVTDQRRRAPGRDDQVANSAGGFVFELDDIARLRRFLILGVDGGTYYASPQKLATENAEVVVRLSHAGDMHLVDTILDISERGAAPRQNATLFALAVAVASPDDKLRLAALAAVPRVCRTFTMLATFCAYASQHRGWGPGLRRAVGRFYTDREPDALAHQMVKYRQREGWTHRDVLRLVHPAGADGTSHGALYAWATGRDKDTELLPDLIGVFQAVQAATTAGEVADLIEAHRLPWETVPDQFLNEPAVLEALLPHMGQTALMRQLPRLTRAGLLEQLSGSTVVTDVAQRLADPEALRHGRVHPINVLVAGKTYRAGRSFKGSSTWTPHPTIIDALEDAFYAAFETVEPTGRRVLNAIDVSGSMGMHGVGGIDVGMTCREAAAALAMVITRAEAPAQLVESKVLNMGFSDQFVPLSFSARSTLREVESAISGLPFRRTDCALPMVYATQRNLEVDTFVVYTDNETWAGDIQPFEALKRYREVSGIDARLVVMSLTATPFSIADPRDAGMLDVVGFDTAAPQVVSEFSAGRL